jgi:hypothetical protein
MVLSHEAPFGTKNGIFGAIPELEMLESMKRVPCKPI